MKFLIKDPISLILTVVAAIVVCAMWAAVYMIVIEALGS